MLTVGDYELIRRKHLVDGMSQRAIARELGHASISTTARYLDHLAPSSTLCGTELGRARRLQLFIYGSTQQALAGLLQSS